MTSPRIPNWNNVAVNVEKHELFRKYITTPMDTQQINGSDEVWIHRHGTLQSVDDMIQDIHDQMKEKGQLNNTYFFYFSDNGFQDGQFGQGGDKRQYVLFTSIISSYFPLNPRIFWCYRLYENDIRIPMYLTGPGIKAKSKTDYFALNIDIAPTLIELAGGQVPDYMDGMSLMKYALDAGEDGDIDDGLKGVKQQFLVEYYGERNNVTTGLYGPPTRPIDSWNNTYDCVRMINYNLGEINGSIYCKFKCYDMISHIEVECPDKNVPQWYGELYDLDKDYYQLNNTILTLNKTDDNGYMQMMTSLLKCKGQSECNKLRQS